MQDMTSEVVQISWALDRGDFSLGAVHVPGPVNLLLRIQAAL